MLQPHQITSRSNSDLLTVEHICMQRNLPAETRMELIAAISAEWERATRVDGRPGRFDIKRRPVPSGMRWADRRAAVDPASAAGQNIA